MNLEFLLAQLSLLYYKTCLKSLSRGILYNNINISGRTHPDKGERLSFNMKAKSIARNNLSDEVVIRIKDLIVNNSLKIGDRLPTEHELAEKFGVSRICVREATKALAFFGIINSAPRRGLTIGSVNMGRIADILSFHLTIDDYPSELLLKSRMVIEIGSLQYVMDAMHKNPDLYNGLIAMCDTLEQTKDPDTYIRQDTEFHSLLVKASGLEPLFAFNDVLQAFFQRFRTRVLKLSPDGLSAGARVHRVIIEALHESNLHEAENKLRYHLQSHRYLLDENLQTIP